jgi:hypothetical protein
MNDLEHEPSDDPNAQGAVPSPPPAPSPPVPPAEAPSRPIPPDPVASEDAAPEAVAPPRPDPLATGIAIMVMVSLLICAIIVLIAAVNA